ncbi:DUF2283 domain-containing protein [Georgenia alba]|uniref:DUF2283 domain-containing protein n=1 Tax=Georgenia alba TaxID=2233858 RepID=A0ABW2QBS5_9MICO
MRPRGDADAANLTVVPRQIEPAEATTQVHPIATPGDRGQVTLDFDAHGRLLGIEILTASSVLEESVIATAERP